MLYLQMFILGMNKFFVNVGFPILQIVLGL